MRLPNAAHEAHPWVIADVASDFTLIDVWRLPAQGGPDDFNALLEIMSSLDPAKSGSRAAHALFRVRHHLGAWFGWDDATRTLPVPGTVETSLRTRLPEGLRGTAAGVDMSASSSDFTALYRTGDEFAAEVSNGTVHAVMHLGWVQEGDGRYCGQMGVYVKPRGALGALYMTAIGPFRHLVVYPALMRQIARAWQARPTSNSLDAPSPRR